MRAGLVKIWQKSVFICVSFETSFMHISCMHVFVYVSDMLKMPLFT